jgi:hypothetical protein
MRLCANARRRCRRRLEIVETLRSLMLDQRVSSLPRSCFLRGWLVVLLVASCAFGADNSRTRSPLAPADVVPGKTAAEINAFFDEKEAALTRDYQKRVAGLKSEKTALEDRIKSLDQQIHNAKETAARHLREMVRLERLPPSDQQSAVAHKATIADLERRIKEKEQEIANCANQIKEARAKIVALDRQISDAQTQYQQARANLQKEREQALRSLRR